MSKKKTKIKEFMDAYIECALWAETDNSDDRGGNPLDENFGPEDFTKESMKQIRKDCEAFCDENWDDISDNLERAGHDFWLTRNGHGCGFWDGDWPEKAGKRLTKASKAYGSCDILVDPNRKLHLL